MSNGKRDDNAPPTARVKKVIFVASSDEAYRKTKKAQAVVRALKREGFAPLPWWDKRAFRPGDYTLERLLELSQTVDAVIVLATKDDRIWYRGRETKAPRDNVVFELGLFVSRLRVKRTLILSDAKARIPSDLAGVTYVSIKNGIDAATKRAAERLREIFSERPLLSTPIITWDPDLVPLIAGDRPAKGWLMRVFYFGTAGARAWLSISTDPQYQDEPRRSPITGCIAELLATSSSGFRTFVSLGPGDGRLDEAIALILREYDDELSYVPIDLSDGLLLHASKRVANVVRVPVGILADFEEKLDLVAEHVQAYAKRPYLYGLLGNTFGNLDGSETTFINRLLRNLKSGDELMMDVAVQRPDSQDVDTATLPPGAIDFFAHGAAVHLREDVAELKTTFMQRAGFDVIERGSEIPKTRTFEFYAKDKSGKRVPCARIRRFDLDSLCGWLSRKGLEIRCHRIAENAPYDSAVLALRRKR